MDAPVLGAPQQHWQCVLLPDHAAVNAEVVDAGIGVLGDGGLESVDVTAAVFAMPFWHGIIE